MKIDLYACGYCTDNGKSTQRAGVAMRLVADNKVRKITHPLGDSATTPMAELMSTIGALLAVKPQHRGEMVTLYAPQYCTRLLETSDGKYTVEPKANVKLVRKLRATVSQFKQLVVVYDKNDTYNEVHRAARECSGDQSSHDTGIMELTK